MIGSGGRVDARRSLGFSLAHAVLTILLVAACATPSMTTPAAKSNSPGASDYSRRAYYVPMRDGVELAVSVYSPVGEGPYPTLLWLMPDRREIIDPRTGEITPTMTPSDLAFFTGHGYAIALAEMRGGGASFGSRELDRGPQIGRDGADLVEWIAAQPWSDGKLGMIGASYQGFAQYATAAEAPNGLRAIFPEIAGFDDYGSMFYPGGILNIALSEYAAPSMALAAQNIFDPDRRQFPSAPVIDEDGDGELVDEIPLDLDGDGGFLDEDEVRYADGNKRQDIYQRATREHANNLQLTIETLAEAPFRDSTIADTHFTYADIDPGIRPSAIARAGIAVYNRGGWFDYHARDTILWHATLAGHTSTRLMMAPTGHGGLPRDDAQEIYRAGPYFAHFGDSSTNAMLNAEKLRFFDYYVRGIDNGFADEAPVLIYVMGEGWRREEEWPLERTIPTRFQLGAGSMLEPGVVAAGQDRYQVDPEASSAPEEANRWNYGISQARAPMTFDGDDSERLQYHTVPLASDTEVTGHPILELVFSADAGEADVFAYLEDVAPDGSSLLVTEGQLRANYHRPVPIEKMLAPEARSMGVRPQLPWQGFRQSDYADSPLANNARLQLTLDLMPTSWVFRKGHRIRLSLAGADWPTFARHPHFEDGMVQHWTVWRGAGLSTLVLPIIPREGY
jgi:putative CocE/NonD family hydrolase